MSLSDLDLTNPDHFQRGAHHEWLRAGLRITFTREGR